MPPTAEVVLVPVGLEPVACAISKSSTVMTAAKDDVLVNKANAKRLSLDFM